LETSCLETKRIIMMNEQVVNREALPEHLLARIQSSQIVVQEDNGSFVLTPLKPKTGRPSRLFGMLAGSGLSTEAYGRQKQLDKEASLS